MEGKYRITSASKILIVKLIFNFIGLIAGCFWGINAEAKKWSGLIYSDVKIADIDLGGKTKEEARNIVKTQYIDAVLKNKLHITIEDKIFTVDKSRLIKSYDMDEVIDNAFNYGKNLSMIEKHELIKTGSMKSYSLDFICDDDFIREFTSNIEKEINKNSTNTARAVKADNLIKLGTATQGYKIEKEKLDKSIEEKIKAGEIEDIHIIAPFKSEMTESELYVINSCISSFSTSFETSSSARVNNIDISVNAINGKLLMPGEAFSFNDIVGERTKERGYMEAPVIIGNKIESGLGGGICQVSSTLYNAILETGINNIQRTHHSLPSSYVGLGLDATVDWGNIDFKFTNTLNYPIYIESYTQNKKLYINIYSNSDLNKKKYIIENNINDSGGVRKVKVIRKVYENEILISSELISDDVYSAPVDYAFKKRY